MKHKLSLILCVLTAFLSLTGCREESLEKEGFQLYYSGVTNIGPNLTVNLIANYFGGEPSEFAITGAKYEGSAYEGPEFTINPENGTVTVAGVPETQPGDYMVSVSCMVNGATLTYNDIIEVTFFKGIPEGITVTPDSMILDRADLMKSSKTNDTTAIVTTDGDHIAVTGYRIANVRFNDTAIDNIASPHFSVSEEGIITVLKNDNFMIGTYYIDLKMNTSSFGSDSEVGIFTDALTVKVVSVPVSFSYTPSSGLLEDESQVPTSFRSNAPIMDGSDEDVVWSIAGCTPENPKLTIDPKTGVLSIAEGHGLEKGVTYVVDVNVKNRYSKDDGLTVEGAYTIETVGYIAPIEHFGYSASEKKQGTVWTINPDEETDAEHIRYYSWTDPTAEYTTFLSLNEETGEISALKGNNLQIGKYEVSVTAANGKANGEVIAVLNLDIVRNPYYFSYFSYGNNLGLTEEQTKGASQFRVKNGDEFKALTADVKYSDISEEAKAVIKWTKKNGNKLNNLVIDSETGAISFPEESGSSFSAEAVGIALITATVTDPEDAENSFSVTVPFCVDFAAEVNGVSITYDPFLIRVNPMKGTRTAAATYTGVAGDKLLLDFRRSFNYYNIDGTDSNGEDLVNGDPSKTGLFLQKIWDKFTEDTGLNKKNGAANYGGKAPMSYYNNSVVKTEEQLSKSGAYVDNSLGANQFTLVVNPGIWYADGWADGVFTGQMTFATDGAIGSVNNGGKRAPIAIWFDKDFEE